MLTPKDIANPKRKSGYDHVQSMVGHPRPAKKNFQAQIGGGWSAEARARRWFGPSRLTALEAAQDYCDYVNSGNAPAPTRLKSPGHKRPQDPRRRVPSDITAARGMIRDWEAQQRKNVQGYVYLIVEVNRGGGLTYGKVGYSTNPEKRVAELQTANPRPLALLYKMKGTEADEKRLHAKYRSINVLQEWFNLNSGTGKSLILEFPVSGACKIPSETLAMVR